MGNRRFGIYDSGVVHNEHQEASIALTWALELAAGLRAAGLKATLSRVTAGDDAPLRLRTFHARQVAADALLSIHVNGAEDDEANGTETLYGSDAQLPFARAVHAAVLPVLGLRDRGTKLRTDLAVLKFGGPAALLELGFLGHDQDRARILDPARQAATCAALVALFRGSV